MGLFGSADVERFNRRVELIPFSECHYWTGAPDGNGYGRISIDGRSWLAHRAAYAIAIADPGEADVLHSCDNPPCVNPAPLRAGTQAENMRDKVDRGRQPTGTKAPRAKLSEDQVVALFKEFGKGTHYSILADRFGLSKPSLSSIRNGKHYREIAAQFLGTVPDARHGNKYDNDTVMAIFRAARAGERNVDVAERFGVHPQAVADIKLGRTHSQLTSGRA